MWEGLDPPYGTIVADPPWTYQNTTGLITRSIRGAEKASAAGNYSTMTNADIADLPVASLAADNAHLFMWVTNPLVFAVPVAPIDIVRAWGFRYVTLLTWVKTGPPGMGYHFRGNTEHVLFAIKGDAKIPPESRESNVITAPRRGHSEKPAAFLDLVERVSPGPYVELFCRRPRFGWDSWGHGYEIGA